MKYTIEVHHTFAIICVYEDRKLVAEYYTQELPNDKLEKMCEYTESDIKNFLRFESGSYYLVK